MGGPFSTRSKQNGSPRLAPVATCGGSTPAESVVAALPESRARKQTCDRPDGPAGANLRMPWEPVVGGRARDVEVLPRTSVGGPSKMDGLLLDSRSKVTACPASSVA